MNETNEDAIMLCRNSRYAFIFVKASTWNS